MDATRELVEEHEVVLAALNLMEKVVAAMEKPGMESREHFGLLLDFFQVFVDRCHHGKEEEVLFPELERLGVRRETGPIGVMLREHDIGRQHVRAMSEALDRLQRGERGAWDRLQDEAEDYANLLRGHIRKENEVLFPTADRLIPADRAALLAVRYEGIEHRRLLDRTHESLISMLDDLKRKYPA
ncbi:MAG: hemerythrin domain-containing protein [Bacteroidota bacterium]|nr:hemerythrin domain-containing protein [Bacteroidota bacterium]